MGYSIRRADWPFQLSLVFCQRLDNTMGIAKATVNTRLRLRLRRVPQRVPLQIFRQVLSVPVKRKGFVFRHFGRLLKDCSEA